MTFLSMKKSSVKTASKSVLRHQLLCRSELFFNLEHNCIQEQSFTSLISVTQWNRNKQELQMPHRKTPWIWNKDLLAVR